MPAPDEPEASEDGQDATPRSVTIALPPWGIALVVISVVFGWKVRRRRRRRHALA
jgi:hypothetical protein